MLQQLSIPFFIVGAVARDFLLEYACGIKSFRSTEDVDSGVRVNSMEEYDQLKQEITASGEFARDKPLPHRLTAFDSLLIDLVPFGPVAGPEHLVKWPNENDPPLNVEAFETAMINLRAVEVGISDASRNE